MGISVAVARYVESSLVPLSVKATRKTCPTEIMGFAKGPKTETRGRLVSCTGGPGCGTRSWRVVLPMIELCKIGHSIHSISRKLAMLAGVPLALARNMPQAGFVNSLILSDLTPSPPPAGL